MSSVIEELPNRGRRRFLTATATLVGAGGLALAAAPFIHYFGPSRQASYAGGPKTVDLSKLEPGQQIAIKWRGKPVWFLRRTKSMLERLRDPQLRQRLSDPDSEVGSQQPRYAANKLRSIEPEIFVVIGLCTHLGCVPTFRPEPGPPDLGEKWPGGYFCPCHGSRFDLAGRKPRGPTISVYRLQFSGGWGGVAWSLDQAYLILPTDGGLFSVLGSGERFDHFCRNQPTRSRSLYGQEKSYRKLETRTAPLADPCQPAISRISYHWWGSPAHGA